MNRNRIKALFIVMFFLSGLTIARSQNGVVLLDTLNLKVVKVWGTHQQRGYAYGYLCGTGMTQIINNYIKPVFGSQYITARNLVIAGNDLDINSRFTDEAQGIIDGMNASGTNPYGLDATDVLVGNCMLDLMGLLGMKSEMGCSSLMNWGDATVGTPLDGKSVISRHLDWQSNSYLLNNQVVLVQQPSEPDEQNWASIGFEGLCAALSGINNHLATFQHVMDDYSGAASQHNMLYKPVWFAMREALERSDYNNDGACNVQDVRASLADSPNGFAAAYIVSALSENNTVDSLVAMIAEIAPQAPKHSFRYNSLPDSIPGDNLYAANYQIGRSNALHFCSRYNSIKSHLGQGTSINLAENWTLMRDYSHQSNNVQFMQFSPEMNHLQIAVRLGQPAYLCDSLVFNTDVLLNTAVNVPVISAPAFLSVYPNPVKSSLYINGLENLKNVSRIEVFNVTGTLVLSLNSDWMKSKPLLIQMDEFNPGIYIIRITSDDGENTVRFVKE
ncbi:MAG: T9SS type A sorting domain-containing protein [Bacteroidales bacterium]